MNVTLRAVHDQRDFTEQLNLERPHAATTKLFSPGGGGGQHSTIRGVTSHMKVRTRVSHPLFSTKTRPQNASAGSLALLGNVRGEEVWVEPRRASAIVHQDRGRTQRGLRR